MYKTKYLFFQPTKDFSIVSFSNGDPPVLVAANISLVDYNSPDAISYSLVLSLSGVYDNESLIIDPATCNITGCTQNVTTQGTVITKTIMAANVSSYEKVSKAQL